MNPLEIISIREPITTWPSISSTPLGVPLLEIVSEPDMRTGKDAYAYGDELRRIVRFLGISDGNMAEGSMRCDVNISVGVGRHPMDQGEPHGGWR